MESKSSEIANTMTKHYHIFKVYLVSIIFVLGLCLLTTSCQEEFFIEESITANQYVVEGYVEAGEGTLPSYVLITQSVPFFDELNPDEFASLFIDNASVAVNDGDQTVQFTKICSDAVPDGPIKDELAMTLGVDFDSIDVDICIYIDLADELIREEGRSYDLTINIGNDQLTATTTIPELVRLDSFSFEEVPGEVIDTLAQLFANIADPEGQTFYRYFTDDDNGTLNTAFSSVTDDSTFDGQDFRFPIIQADATDVDFGTYGFFNVGDTITFKWTTIDAAHFKFWDTFEFSLNGQGSPFTSYTRIAGNVEGGFGIWGGYAVQFEELVVDKTE
jgi:hypothetical protein